MSQFLDDFRASLEKVAQGGATDPETKAAVSDLVKRMTDNEASDAEVKTAVT